MGIVVQHQPPLTALSELAFQTGQLQYRNQRRRELEAQQLAQAQMAQKERLAQMQVMANTQSQMRGHQQGMQRLAYQNMMGQQSQFGQHQLQMIQQAERAKQQRELANIYGENNVQAANVASENRMFERQQSAIKDMYDNVLNQQGQEALHGLLGQQQELKMSPDISPEEKQQQMEQIEQQIFQLREDPSMTLGRDQMPGHVRRKDDIYEEVRQADGNYIPRVRTTRSVTLPDGSIVTENIPIEEIRAKTDKVEPIEGTDQIRVTRFNPATGQIDETTHQSNKLTPEQELKQKDNEQAAIKQVYDAYSTYKDARDAAKRAYEEAVSMSKGSDAASLVAPDDALSFTDWINSKDGILQKEMLKRAGIDVDALMREWEVKEWEKQGATAGWHPGVMGEGPPVPADVAAFHQLKDMGVIPEDQEFERGGADAQEQPQPEQIAPEEKFRGEVNINEWRPTSPDGSPNPIPMVDEEGGKAYKNHFHPNLALEVDPNTGRIDEGDYHDAMITFEQNLVDFYLDSDDPNFDRRDRSGMSYQLGTSWVYKDQNGELKDMTVNPAAIENAIFRATDNPDKARAIRDKALADYQKFYGVPWRDTQQGNPKEVQQMDDEIWDQLPQVVPPIAPQAARDTFDALRQAAPRDNRMGLAELVPKLNAMAAYINLINPDARLPEDITVSSLAVMDEEDYNRFIDSYEGYYTEGR